jgi:hypothetical protein
LGAGEIGEATCRKEAGWHNEEEGGRRRRRMTAGQCGVGREEEDDTADEDEGVAR